MQDAIIKGIGNSRYLKTVGEALSLYPTYEDFLQAMIAGTFPVDFNGINKDGWTQQGTPLNKANLLSDTVISTLGLSTGVNSTPNDAFNVLANIGNVHAWRKTVVTEEGVPEKYELGPEEDKIVFSGGYYSNGRGKTIYGTEIQVNEAGGLTLSGTTATIDDWFGNLSSDYSVIKGKYVRFAEHFSGSYPESNLSSDCKDKYFYIPASAQLTYTDGSMNKDETNYGLRISKMQLVTGISAVPPGTHVTYLTSTNRNAYQNGTDGSEKPAGYTLGAVKTGKKALSDLSNYIYSVTWQYGDSVAVSDDGKVSIKNPTQISISATNDSEIEKTKVILGKFATPVSNCGFEYGKIYFFPSDSQISRESLPIYDTITTNIDKYQEVTGYPAIPAGTTIEYLGALGDKSQVQVISYVGTGTYGEANPCSVTARFPIKALFSLGYGGTFGFDPPYTSVKNGSWGDKETGIMINEFLTTTFAEHMGFIGSTDTSIIFGKKSEDGKTFYWYTPGESSAGQLNSSGYSYYFLALR